MKNNLKKGTALTMAAALALSLSACGGTAASSTAPAADSTTSTAGSTAETTGAVAPDDGNTTLKVFGDASVWLPSNETSVDASPFLVELQKATGVTLDLTAISGDTQQQFNLMIAGGQDNLPDIIDNTNRFEGGAQAAYESGYIIDLTPYIDEYAPNYRKYLDEHPDIDRLMKTDDGKYLTFPMIRGDDALCSFNGLIVRKDWLDADGLSVPVTMDDWHTMLTTFKEKNGATAPLVIDAKNHWHYRNFASAYGADYEYYVNDDGKVDFGPIQPGFKDYLTEMNKWYEEGLIDQNYLTADQNAREAAITSGQAGALWYAVGGGIGKYITAARDGGDDVFDLVGVPTPVLKEGDTPALGFKADAANNNGLSISTNCKNVALAMKFLDYGFSEEGDMLYNYGTEGVSYEMVDGKPTYTDLIMKNPDGLTASQAMGYYIGANHMNGGFVQELGYYNQYLALPQQQQAIQTWADNDGAKHLLPPFSMTAEESKTAGAIDTEIWTYVDENVAAFITGTTSLDEFDNFVATIQDMGVEDSIACKQAALDRYNAK
ncbi:MAG: extracellular solute-binding protein [Gemmiger sp.]|nr:extracellular solute-binding protein [Gemmiger sp.]